MLLDIHSYIDWYYHVYELIKEKPVDKQQKIRIRLYVDSQHDPRTHNLSTAKEIAVIISEEGVYYAIDNRNVILQAKEEQLEQISQNSLLYTTFYYVLLFPKKKKNR